MAAEESGFAMRPRACGISGTDMMIEVLSVALGLACAADSILRRKPFQNQVVR